MLLIFRLTLLFVLDFSVQQVTIEVATTCPDTSKLSPMILSVILRLPWMTSLELLYKMQLNIQKKIDSIILRILKNQVNMTFKGKNSLNVGTFECYLLQ